MMSNSSARVAACIGMVGTATFAAANVHADLFTDYRLVVRGNLDSASQVSGRAAIGGNLSGTSNYGVGLGAPAYTGMDVLIVGGNISSHVNMHAGNLRLGGSSGSAHLNMNGGGSVIADSGAASRVALLGAQMEVAATTFAALQPTASVILPVSQPAGVTFSAAPGADGVAVFNVAGSTLFSNANVQQLSLAMNGATSVVINVSGANIAWTSGNFVGGFTSAFARSHVIWNFYEATSIDLGGRSMNGSVLAPMADVRFEGAMQGSLWANSVTQRAAVQAVAYAGVVPSANSVALLAVAGCIGSTRRRKAANDG